MCVCVCVYKVGVQVQYIFNDLLPKQIQVYLERGFVMHEMKFTCVKKATMGPNLIS